MNTLTKYWFLDGFNLFNKLGRGTMMNICTLLEMENIDKGTVFKIMNNEKRSIFFLKKGTVKIVDTTNGTTKYIVKRGNIFGELSIYDEQAAVQEQAFALEDCIVCYIETEMMDQLMEKHRSLKNGVLKIYGIRIRKLERRLQDLIYKDSPTRIKEFIFDYLEEFGKKNDDGILVAKNLLTHKEIANLTSTSRQTVNNILSTMRKKGIINYNAHYIAKPN